MRRTIMIIIIACVAVFTTQCKKAEVQNPTDGISDELIDVTLSVGTGTKTVIDGIGHITWKANDEIRVFGETAGCLGILTTIAGGDPATFTGKIHGITKPQILRFYYFGSDAVPQNGDNFTFSIANNQDGTLTTIADKLHLAYGESEYPVQPGTTNLGTISMTSKIAIADFHFTRADGYPFGKNIRLSGFYTSITFNAKTGVFQAPANLGTITISRDNIGDHYYVALLPGEQTLSFSNYVVGKTLGAKVIEENSMYGVWNSETSHYDKPIEVVLENINNVPNGALAGTFKIGSDNYVYFAKGNLYKDGDNWGFEANQCDYRTIANLNRKENCVYNATGTPANNFGLFGWSGDTYKDYGAKTSDYDVDYAGEFYDWGQIASLPGNTETSHVWYTLSKSQWEYLLGQRPDNAKKRTDFGTQYNPNAAYVLLPEEVPSEDCSAVISDIKTSGLTDAEVMAKLGSYGALLLPSIGTRNSGTALNNFGVYGYYHTSDKNGANNSYCYILNYNGSSSSAGSYYLWPKNRHYSQAVRLVRGPIIEGNGSAEGFGGGTW